MTEKHFLETKEAIGTRVFIPHKGFGTIIEMPHSSTYDMDTGVKWDRKDIVDQYIGADGIAQSEFVTFERSVSFNAEIPRMKSVIEELNEEVERLTAEREALGLALTTWEETFSQMAGGEVQEFDMGEVSDGYHTFNELYRHRAVLFAALQSAYRSRSWKSRKHADGTMFDGMFIAGIETPKGQYTYHVDLNEWALFSGRELLAAPEWDGHEPKDVGRLLTLPLRDEAGEKWKERYDALKGSASRTAGKLESKDAENNEEISRWKAEASNWANIAEVHRGEAERLKETLGHFEKVNAELKEYRKKSWGRLEALGEAQKALEDIHYALPEFPGKAKALAIRAAAEAAKAIEGE